MRIKILICCIGLMLCHSYSAFARGRFSLGPELGFVYQTHMSPNSSFLEGAPAASLSLTGAYQFDRELSRFAVDYVVGFLQTSSLTYRGVKIEGAEGTFREKLTVLHWLLGGRYYLRAGKWIPYLGLGTGLSYFRRSNVSYRDQFDSALPKPPLSNHLNISLAPSFGLEYRPTVRWAWGLGVRPIFSFRQRGVVPSVQVLSTVQIAF